MNDQPSDLQAGVQGLQPQGQPFVVQQLMHSVHMRSMLQRQQRLVELEDDVLWLASWPALDAAVSAHRSSVILAEAHWPSDACDQSASPIAHLPEVPHRLRNYIVSL